MKPWTTWLARLGIAGACVLAVGCGGGGVPDPSADEQAASESAPPSEGGGGSPPPAMPGRPGPRMANASKAGDAPAEETTDAAPEPEKPAAPPKTEGGSATAEMLALATSPNPNGSANTQPGSGTTPATAQGGSPPAGAAGGMRQMMQAQGGSPPNSPGGSGGPPPGGAASGGGGPMRPGSGIGGNNAQTDMASRMQNSMQSQRAQMAQAGGQGRPGGPPGAGGRPGGQGGPGGNDKPADFHTPYGAVKAFLSALDAKDHDRLAEASALRASLEPPTKNQNLFKKIFDTSLSDSEMDDLAKSFEGYTIAGENPVKSTGRVEIVLQKSGDDGSRYTRVVTVRKEKKGWGVLLLKSATEFKPLGQTPRRRTGNG